VRLRILNASSRRFYTLGLANEQPFQQIASDGGLLPGLVPLTRLEIGPAERAEIVVDLSPSDPTVLQALPLGGGFGGRGNGGGNGQPTTVLTLETTADAPSPHPLPVVLSSVERLDPGRATVVRDIRLARSGRGFSINGQTMTSMDDMMDSDRTMRVQLGDIELWRVQNSSGVTHLFHVHDVQFQIVDRNGLQPNPNEAGWKDTVMVHPNETVRIIMTFADYADPSAPYMFHCHILAHEDAGMMGQFIVVPRPA
jgi:FtsP/CotA-like multicopper oxidase with cupredoxin domain